MERRTAPVEVVTSQGTALGIASNNAAGHTAWLTGTRASSFAAAELIRRINGSQGASCGHRGVISLPSSKSETMTTGVCGAKWSGSPLSQRSRASPSGHESISTQ